MAEVLLAEVDRAFATLTGVDAATRWPGDPAFDGLLAPAVEGCASLVQANPALMRGYSWVTSAGAFASALEAWMQHEVVESHRTTPADASEPPAVVRIAPVETSDVVVRRAGGCWFVIIDPMVIWAHVHLADAVRKILELTGEPYEDEDRWCRSDLVGGAQLERLARSGRLPEAIVVADRWLRRGPEVPTGLDLRPPLEWLPTVARTEDLLGRLEVGSPEWIVERLVRAPLRFAIFQAWRRLAQQATNDVIEEHHWAQAAADAGAVRRLLAVEEGTTFHGADRRAFMAPGSTGTGLAVFLQLARLRRIETGRSEAARLLTLASEQRSDPRVQRLPRLHVQVRCINAGTWINLTSDDPQSGYFSMAVFEEMQIFYGLVAALALAATGGRADLPSMCSVGWADAERFIAREDKMRQARQGT